MDIHTSFCPPQKQGFGKFNIARYRSFWHDISLGPQVRYPETVPRALSHHKMAGTAAIPALPGDIPLPKALPCSR
jgi:hypothetical protein